MYLGLHVKYLLFLSDFQENSIFSTDFGKKNAQISNLMKIHPVGAEMLYGNGRTNGDRHEEASSRLSQIWERS